MLAKSGAEDREMAMDDNASAKAIMRTQRSGEGT